MDIEETLQSTLEEILVKLGTEYSKVTVSEEESNEFNINIESDNPSLLIGHRGENIQALQHVLKVIIWKKLPNEQFNIVLDIDGYRKRQEENVQKLADRKIEYLRKNGRPQVLPPMSAYFRRKVHTLCMGPGYDDVETYSKGEGDNRQVVIKLKS